MVSPSPVRFSPALLARKLEQDNGLSERLSVAFPLSQCKRLLPLLSGIEPEPESGPESGPGQCKAEFALKLAGKHIHAVGEFSVSYTLQCQRCLQNFDLDVSEKFDLVFVADQLSAEALADDLDPVVLDDNGMIHVVDLFEDELIFHVPTVPKHATVDLCVFGTEIVLDGRSDDGPGVAAGGVMFDAADSPLTQREESGGKLDENPFAVLKKLHIDK